MGLPIAMAPCERQERSRLRAVMGVSVPIKICSLISVGRDELCRRELHPAPCTGTGTGLLWSRVGL